ncbi:MAG: tRNA lysidine(34) synthetase TilS [Chloroflexi bacterium]|nr:tRNA lysidine(34) synthetase TilS [Chloroflexota bacterium]
MSLNTTLDQFFDKYAERILSPIRVLVGVSGGPDSVALLHALVGMKEALNLEIHAAHLNHGIRGEEAKDDYDYVIELCNLLSVQCHLKDQDVPALAKLLSVSLEEAARRARYEFFGEIMTNFDFPLLLVAHTANDQAETVLMRLLRGSGLQGLAGILPLSRLPYSEAANLWVGRPLLEIWRNEIEDYCAVHKLTPHHDSTNHDMRYTRNRIRHELLPLLEDKYQHGAAANLARFATLAADEEEWLDELTGAAISSVAVEQEGWINRASMGLTSYEDWANIVEGNQSGSIFIDPRISRDWDDRHIVIDLAGFSRFPLALQRRALRLVYFRLKERLENLEHKHIESILTNLDKAGWKIILPGNVQAQVYSEKLVLGFRGQLIPDFGLLLDEAQLIEIEAPASINFKGALLECDVFEVDEETNWMTDRWVALLDADKTGTKLTIRGRKAGERFKPLGAPGRKKLQDYMVDAAIPRQLRERYPLVVRLPQSAGDSDKIVWVVGFAIGDEFKVTDETSRILRLSISFT